MDDVAGYVAPRTCTVVDEGDPQRDGGRQAPLTDYADTRVLTRFVFKYTLTAQPEPSGAHEL